MNFEKGNVLIVDNLYSKQECMDMINYFKSNERDSWNTNDYRNTSILPLVLSENQKPVNNFGKDITLRLAKRFDGSFIRIQRSQIEKRHIKSSLNFHFDSAFGYTAYTSVTYLNDDYDGGRTIIRPPDEETSKYDLVIQPKVGRTIFFNGAENFHSVTGVSGNERYTLATWYMTMPADLPEKHKWWI